ncbi:MAG: sugar phosphate isomerase/epimerase [Planctomycetota bacterium]|jgi:sugar phosphate isomerase/epimerase|nr:sugar phosphate isomerase/epimerase [Planctomycetota bacterium]
MQLDRVALQLYTMRNHLTTEADVRSTLKRVAAIGYKAVQISGVQAPLSEAELVSICDGEGLTICSTHEGGAGICDNPQAICDRLNKLGCKHTAYPYPHQPLDTIDQVTDLAAKLDAAGKVFADNGLILSYHNHAIEFRKFGGKTALEIIFDETDPKHLEAELDLYWVQQGGGNPATWINKVAGRQTVVHMKDYGVPAGENQGAFCEVGNGNLEWDSLIPLLDKTGVQWFAVEQDQCPGDEFESVTQSFNYLKTKAS